VHVKSTVRRAGRPALERRVLMFVVALLAAAGVTGGVAAPASADSGVNHYLWISASGGSVHWEHWPGSPTGEYHINFWGVNTNWNTNTPNYWKVTNDTEYGILPGPVPAGVMVCGNLWYHKPAGGYGSYGLPCVAMS
jgi:hypothetical protein